MTQHRLPRNNGTNSPPPLLNLRLLVLVLVAGLLGWLAFVNPTVAGAVGVGLTTLYLLHRLVGR